MSELIKALAVASPTIGAATKTAANDFLKSKYADINSVIQALQPLKEHGLWFIQKPINHESGASIETFIIHTSGEELSAGICFVPAPKKDPQGFGSAMTYARRYGLMAAFGMATDDDDGNAAQKAHNNSPSEPMITSEKIEQVKMLCQVADVAEVKIKERYKVDDLARLTMAQSEKAINQLNATIDKNNQKDAA